MPSQVRDRTVQTERQSTQYDTRGMGTVMTAAGHRTSTWHRMQKTPSFVAQEVSQHYLLLCSFLQQCFGLLQIRRVKPLAEPPHTPQPRAAAVRLLAGAFVAGRAQFHTRRKTSPSADLWCDSLDRPCRHASIAGNHSPEPLGSPHIL